MYKNSFKSNLKLYPTLKFTTSEIDRFFKQNPYLSMYASEPRKLHGRKNNYKRDAQPYIFSNLPFESFELDIFRDKAIKIAYHNLYLGTYTL